MALFFAFLSCRLHGLFLWPRVKPITYSLFLFCFTCSFFYLFPFTYSLFLFCFTCSFSHSAYVARMLRVCCAAFRIPFVSLAYPLRFARWHFGSFVFWMRFLGFLRLSSLNRYLPSTYKVSSKSHSLKFSSQNPINPIFLSHYLSLFRSACSYPSERLFPFLLYLFLFVISLYKCTCLFFIQACVFFCSSPSKLVSFLSTLCLFYPKPLSKKTQPSFTR